MSLDSSLSSIISLLRMHCTVGNDADIMRHSMNKSKKPADVTTIEPGGDAICGI